MGVYRWYLIFPLIVYSAFSYSATPDLSNILSRAFSDADSICSNKPSITDTFEPYYFHGGNYYVNYKGCIYVGKGVVVAPDGTDYAAADWLPVKALPPDIPMNESHIRKPDSGDDSGGDTGDTGDTGGGSTEPSNPGITPPVKPPVKPPVLPDSSSVRQLYDQYNNCTSQLNSYPMSDYDDYNPAVDYNYNAQVRQCNSILDRLTSLIKSNSINGATDAYNFLTGNGSGGFYICKQNPYTPQEWADMGKLYPGPVLGYQLNKLSEREIGFNCHIVHDSSDGKDKNHCSFHLNFNYTKDNGNGTSVCNSVYTSSLNPGESGGSGGGSHEGSCPAGQFNIPGQGCMTVQCPAGSHPVAGATSSDAPTCETDTGSSGGDTGSGDDSGPGLSTPSLDVPDLTLAPLWNIWPSARDFKLTLPAAQCPVFNIEVFGTTHKIDTFCTLFTPDIIAIIRAICILTASIISFVIVLRS
ncbi:hypothetical protein ISI59_001742 [Salmonella enterica]|nr:hypothetical protein [Salmonella enterica]EDR5914986.1 hypothetical protein [Salmonella enterica subsp. diarizonae]EGE5595232.1 hypothetical protein [Salmonella enterica subsp. enterica serovar Adelaide]EGN5726233.1 hypothetical protein [Salmonella enterica]